MNVLVVNCGSSSLKYQLLDMTTETELAKGLFEKIGDQDAMFTHKRPNADKLERVEPLLNHKEALLSLIHIFNRPCSHGCFIRYGNYSFSYYFSRRRNYSRSYGYYYS